MPELQGNLILTDSKYEILTLLRSHRDDAQGVAFMARHPYPLQYVRLRQAVTAEALQPAIDQDSKATYRSEPPTSPECPASFINLSVTIRLIH